MVLNLVVEAAIPKVGERVGSDISAGQHLSAQEVQPAVVLQNGHAFVVGSEDRGQV